VVVNVTVPSDEEERERRERGEREGEREDVIESVGVERGGSRRWREGGAR